MLLQGDSRNVTIFLSIFVAPKAYRRLIIGLGTVLLSHLVSKLQKPSSSVLDPKTNFRGFGISSCNLLAKTNMALVQTFYYA
jgi:hypothetical protein